MWIDTHAHLAELNDNEYLRTLESAREAGVGGVINIGTNITESHTVVEQTKIESKINTFAVVGIAVPESNTVADNFDWVKNIEELAKNPAVVGIGETGLDFAGKDDYPPKEVQLAVFEKHIDIAKRLDKPIIIHSRAAEIEAFAMLFAAGLKKVLFHCFTGNKNIAEKIVDAGYFISFSGIATFKNAGLDDAIRAVPSNQILVETDSPYLAPVPYRGKKNEPAFVKIVGEKVANIRNISPDAFAEQTTENARNFFRIS